MSIIVIVAQLMVQKPQSHLRTSVLDLIQSQLEPFH